MNQSPFSTAQFYPAAGEILDGKYEVEHILGEGGMGAVAKAVHLLRRAPVALKFMSPAVLNMPGAVERFINEGVAASQIDSDHVVKIFDVGRLATGAPYLVMEFLEGRDLSSVLEREGNPGLPVARAVHFVLQTLRGLQVAHAAGIVHRDMKPSNCFVITKDDEMDFVKLVDFGISKVNQEGGGQNITKTNSALGTPVYMSPEQARSPRDVDLRSDLYSVGVVLYELLCGRTPFTSASGEFTEILFKIFTEEPPPIRNFVSISEGLAKAVHGALVRNPNERYATAAQMGDALAPYADERSNHVLQRLRNYEIGRISRLPAQAGPGSAAWIKGADIAAASFQPRSAEARVGPGGAMARTQVGEPGAPPPTSEAAGSRAWPVSIPPPPPRTEMDVSTDAAAKGSKKKTGVRLAITVVAIGIPAALIGGFYGRPASSPRSAAVPTPTAIMIAPTPSPTIAQVPAPEPPRLAPPASSEPVIPAPRLALSASPTPAPTPTAPGPKKPATTPAHPGAQPNRSSGLPTDLNGLGLH